MHVNVVFVKTSRKSTVVELLRENGGSLGEVFLLKAAVQLRR